MTSEVRAGIPSSLTVAGVASGFTIASDTSRTFTGELAEYREPRTLDQFTSSVVRTQLEAKWRAEDSRKLGLLSQHYGLPATDFERLCIAIAEDFVPGFQDKNKRKTGRPTKWHEWASAVLVVEMNRTIKKGQTGKGIKWAATQLAKGKRWGSFVAKQDRGRTSPDPAEVLRQQYMRSRGGRYAKLLTVAYQGYERRGELLEWERMASSLLKPAVRTSDLVKNL